MLLSISLILIVGMFMGWLCQKCRLPSLLGMLATGMVLGPYVLNLLDGEKPFGRLHITRLLLVAQRPPAGNGIDGPQATVEIVNRKSHRLLADSNKCRTRKRRLLCTYVDGAEQRTCKKGT